MKGETTMEVWVSKSNLYETVVTTDYEVAHLIMQLHKDTTLIHYNEDGKTIVYHLTYRKEKK